MNAAFIAIGMEADVFVYDTNIDRLRELDVTASAGDASTRLLVDPFSIEERLPDTDLVIGGRARPRRPALRRVIKRDQLALMKTSTRSRGRGDRPGRLLQHSSPTTHQDPTFKVDGVILHYCVTNMPGAVPITSTYALTNATLPYVLALADHGVAAAAANRDPGLKLGVNVAAGQVTHRAVAEAVGMDYVPPEEALAVGPEHCAVVVSGRREGGREASYDLSRIDQDQSDGNSDNGLRTTAGSLA